MRKRWHGVAAVALGAALLGGGVLSASAMESRQMAPSGLSAAATTGHQLTERAASLFQVGDGEAAVVAGSIDDGAELLPKADITLAEAIAAAQTAANGKIGEVDLEYFDGTLVFNVDVDNQDVKVDAHDGTVLGAASDD